LMARIYAICSKNRTVLAMLGLLNLGAIISALVSHHVCCTGCSPEIQFCSWF
jgi:hypothetical protein